MGVLVFVCPTSGHEVVEIDPASYQGLKHETAEIKCSACGLSHNFFQIETRLVDDNLQIGTTKD
jgi:transcription elongation factor Elf1